MKFLLAFLFLITTLSYAQSNKDSSKNRALTTQDLNKLFYDDIRKQREEMNRTIHQLQRQLFYGGDSYSISMQVKYKEDKEHLHMIVPLKDPKRDQVKVDIKDRVITIVVAYISDSGTATREQSFAIPSRVDPNSSAFKQEGNDFIISFKKL